MSTNVPLPHLLVEVLPHNVLFLSSPTQSIFVSKKSGDVLYTTTYSQPMQAPRCSSVHSLSGSQLPEVNADCLIALLGDDKELNVIKVSGLISHKVDVEKIFSKPLPKRGVKMVWEKRSEMERTLIVGDRHGDVRSFDISLKASTTNGEQVAKRRKIEAAENEEEDDEDLDSTNPPHLGHVSMLTDFILTSFTSTAPQSPASFIVTSDRDEHIRISRWGKRKAGHLALRYLLGSTAAIGGMCIIEHKHLSTLQQAVQTDAAKDICRQPLLLSTDSSRLRIWSLHKDVEVSNRPNCLLVVDLYDIIQQYVKIDPMRERNRLRFHGKGKADRKKKIVERIVEEKQTDDAVSVEEVGEGERKPIVMLRLIAMEADDDVFVSFLVDGSSGLFAFSLSKLLASSKEEAASHVQVLDMGLPILHHAEDLLQGEKEPHLWMTCDVRQNPVGGVRQRGLRSVTWSREDRRWTEDENSLPLIQNEENLQSEGTPDSANSLLLYDALTLYPKQEFETSASVRDAIGPNGLVRGGLTNFTSLGQYKGGVNKMDEQRTSSKKAKAREVMLQRIGQALEGTESKDKSQDTAM